MYQIVRTVESPLSNTVGSNNVLRRLSDYHETLSIPVYGISSKEGQIRMNARLSRCWITETPTTILPGVGALVTCQMAGKKVLD